MKRVCRWCGGPIPQKKRSDSIYCSKKCRIKSHGPKENQRKIASRGGPFNSFSLNCKYCGVEFIPEDRNQKYCIPSHRTLFHRAKQRVSGFVCLVCGGRLPFAEKHGGKHKYCTDECVSIARNNRKQISSLYLEDSYIRARLNLKGCIIPQDLIEVKRAEMKLKRKVAEYEGN